MASKDPVRRSLSARLAAAVRWQTPEVDVLREELKAANKLDRFRVVRWATTDSPVVRSADGHPDDTAHHVLLVLAIEADGEGRNVRLPIKAIADACLLTNKQVRAALQRLVKHGLIEFDGTDVGRLRLCIERHRDGEKDRSVAR
jgi:hypothetical protein